MTVSSPHWNLQPRRLATDAGAGCNPTHLLAHDRCNTSTHEHRLRSRPDPVEAGFALPGPLHGGVLPMGGLTVSGVLVGLGPPLVLGALISALVARNASVHAALPAGVVAVATLLEAGAYVASDGMYARNVSRLYRDVRLQMFRGAVR